MKKYLPLFVLLGAGMTVGIPQALAETPSATTPKAAQKAPTKKMAVKMDREDSPPDVAGHTRVDYNCDLGSRISVYEKAEDGDRIGLRWNKEVHQLKRVQTSTGAHRFESKDAGLVWINIPAKGMLLDSKKGQQLANECKSPGQMKAKKSAA